jgi:hypothetical protein
MGPPAVAEGKGAREEEGGAGSWGAPLCRLGFGDAGAREQGGVHLNDFQNCFLYTSTIAIKKYVYLSSRHLSYKYMGI